MITLLKPLLETIIGMLRSRALLHLEILALRQQLAMIADRDRKRMRFHQKERLFWVMLYRCWPGCLRTLQVRRRVKSLGIKEVKTAPRSPWQNPYVERVIGSIRSDCLNHSIVLNERHLRRLLKSYFAYYHEARTHLALAKQCPKFRTVESPEKGQVIALPHIGGLHHEYRRAA